MTRFTLILVALVCLVGSLVASDIPRLVNVQGKLTDSSGDPVSDGTYSVRFTIYDAATGGNSKWQSTRSVGTLDGLFSVQLGSSTTLPDTVFNHPDRWLGIKVGTDDEMLPRQRFTAVPYHYDDGWEDNDTIVCLENSDDIVGIGTNSPSAKLDVLTTADNGTAVEAYTIGGDNTKFAGIFKAYNDGDYQAGVWAEAGQQAAMDNMASSGNVGIYARCNTNGTGIYPPFTGNWAGYFRGDVKVIGEIDLTQDITVGEDATVEDDLTVNDRINIVDPLGAIVGGYRLQVDGAARIDTLDVIHSIRFAYDYNSGWLSMTEGQIRTITHSLGDDEDDYVIYMDGKSSNGSKIHQANFGTAYCGVGCGWIGCEWYDLTSSSIKVKRADDDNTGSVKDWDYVRIRIIKNQ